VDIPRSVAVGGASRTELLRRLAKAGVMLNESAQILLACSGFTTSPAATTVAIKQCSLKDLGFNEGGTFPEIIDEALRRGLSPCRLELAAHLRLQFMDQPEGAVGQPQTRNCAPPGSITVASLPISDDDDFPKGFYLRRIDGVPWLRGYKSWAGHLWSPDDVFVFTSG
jgi:hypothetical protein